MLGKFHTICDDCKSQGEEYQAHTNRCLYCGNDICEDCKNNPCGVTEEGYLYVHTIRREY